MRLESKSDTADEQNRLQNGESKPKTKTVDDFLQLGWYNVHAVLSSEFVFFNMLSNMVYMMYGGVAPIVKSCGNIYANKSGADICDQYNMWRPQNECIPELEYQFLSVNVEFDYLCAEGKAVKTSISIQMLGILAGTLFFGQMSDSYGRRTVLLISSTTAIIFGGISSFAGSLWTMTAWRFLAGFFAGGELIVIMVYNMEVTPKQHRLWVSTITTFSPNFILMAILAYYTHDWRSFARGISIVSLPVIPLVYFTVESPRWLFQKGKTEELRKALRRIRGKTHEDPKTEMELEQMLCESKLVANDEDNKKQHYAYHLFYTWELLTYSCVIGIGMFVTSIINYGLLFNIESLSGSIYLNSIFFGIFRWALNIAAGAVDYFVPAVGRKVLHFFSVAFIAVCIAINFVVFAFELNEFHFLIRYCALAAAAMCAQLYLTKTLAMVELYPTAVRNIATSTMGILSRIGNTLAPQLFYLGEIWIPLPYLTMALLALWDLTNFQVFLPETKGKPLKDHLPGPEECIWRRRSKRIKSSGLNAENNPL